MLHTKLALLSSVLVASLVVTSCAPGSVTPGHPGEISVFDGQCYDSLLAASAVLNSFKAIADKNEKYKKVFNTAAVSFNATYGSYVVFRHNPKTQADVVNEIAILTPAVAELITTIQNDLNPTKGQIQTAEEKIRVERKEQAKKLSAHYTTNISLQSVLNYIEIAASIASTIPGASQYGQLALLVVQAAQTATGAVQSVSGQPIDLSKISPVALLA